MTFLTTHLSFPGTDELGSSSHTGNDALPSPGTHLVITDTLQSPATFTLYHLTHAAIAQKRLIIWVDLKVDGKKSIEAVMRRMGVTLPKPVEQFRYIQPSSFGTTPNQAASPPMFDSDDSLDLRPLYEAVQNSLNSNDSLVILHGLSDLLSLGFPVDHAHRFVRAVHSAVYQNGGVLVSTLHADDLSDGAHTPDHALLERLMRSASGWWRVEELASGRSGDVHGEISSHALSGTEGWTTVPRSQPLQYRLETNTVKVFPKGTGRGYL